MTRFASILVSALTALTLSLGAAQAATLTIWDHGAKGTISCSGDCVGLKYGKDRWDRPVSEGITHDRYANIYNIRPASETSMMAALRTLTGEALEGLTASRTETGDLATYSFTTAADYIAFKVGMGTVFVENTSGGSILIDFAKALKKAGCGTGLSNITEFSTAAVPVPGAAILFGTGLLGVFGAKRRRKAA